MTRGGLEPPTSKFALLCAITAQPGLREPQAISKILLLHKTTRPLYCLQGSNLPGPVFTDRTVATR